MTLEDDLAAVTADFRKGVPLRLAEVRALVDKAQGGGPEARENRRRARNTAHALAGTAGSYGLMTVYEAMARVEDLLEAEDDPVDWIAVARSLDEAEITYPQG
jgi:HPt (histidine-containing phosphotransfer) domain-containing protein